MTVVCVQKKGKQHSMEISGHVMRPEGVQQNDICVAVSILAQTLIQTLRNHVEMFDTYTDELDPDAYAYVFLECKEEFEGYVSAFFEQTETGLEMLARQFPDDVRMVGEKEKAL